MAQPSIDGTLALSHPYYRAAYMLVHRLDTRSARTLSELAGQHLGVEMVSIPIFALKQRGHKVYALDDTEAVIDAVGDGRIDYGYVWGPAASALLADRKDVVISPEFLPTDQWDFAIALRPDSKLIGPTNRAVERLLAGGVIEKIFRRYEVPYLSLEKLSGEASCGGQMMQPNERLDSSRPMHVPNLSRKYPT